MSPPDAPASPFTDAPALRRDPLSGGLQLLAWIFLRPSAWRNHLAHIDPTLEPDFTLVELSRTHWGDPLLLRTISLTYLIRSWLIGVLVALALATAGVSGEGIAFGVAVGVGVGVAGGMVGDIAVGLAAGTAGGFVGGFVGGTAYGLAGVGSVTGIFATSVAGVVALGVSGCLSLGVAGGVIAGLAGRRAHSWGWEVGVSMVGILSSCVVYGLAFVAAYRIADGELGGVRFGVVLEVEAAVGFGLVVSWRTRDWVCGAMIAGVFAVVVVTAVVAAQGVEAGWEWGIARGATLGMAVGAGDGMLICSIFAMSYALARHIGGPRAGAVAGVLGTGGVYLFFSVVIARSSVWIGLPIALACTVAGLSVMWWLPVLSYPFTAAWNIALLRADERRPGSGRGLLRWNSSFWDEIQYLPQAGLEEHLILTMERHPAEARDAIEYLASGRQRGAIQAAQIEMDARRLERCADVTDIGKAFGGRTAGEQEGPASTLLRGFSRISQDVDAALNQMGMYNQRLILNAVEKRLDEQLNELTRSGTRYAMRFHPIASRWRKIVANQIQKLVEESAQRQEINSPYVASMPLNEQQEVFVGRSDVAARIERLLLDRRQPPLLLYGQKRMGKTSLLHNLGRLLSSNIVPMFVDLQGPVTSARDYASFLYNIARAMRESAGRHRNLAFPELTRAVLAVDPFTSFDEWLDRVERALGDSTALLELDELEALDNTVSSGHFESEEVLGMLRHLIQHRPRFRVLLAGSHTLDELQHWSSFLINVHVIKLTYLSEVEASQLIERPVKDFPLRYEPEAVQRVLDITRGHPALVQLLCDTIVAIKNEQPPASRRTVDLADVRSAIPKALNEGALFVFINIQREIGRSGQAILRFMASHGEAALISREALTGQFAGDLDDSLALLSRRDLIEHTDRGYRFQVEMIRRWFTKPNQKY